MLVLVEIGQPFLMLKDNNKIQTDELAIHKFDDGFYFCSNKNYDFKDFNFFKKNKIFEDYIHSIGLNNLSRISYIEYTRNSFFLPKILFEHTKKDLYLKMFRLNNKTVNANTDNIDSHDIINLYNLDKSIVEIISEKINLKNISHYKTLLFKAIINSKIKGLKQDKIYLHIQKESFDLFYFKDIQFHLCNSFQITNVDDFLYYLFYFIEQFNLINENLSIIFMGKYSFFNTFYDATADFHEEILFDINENKNIKSLQNHYAPFLSNVISL
jgi:hypothetical protein